MSRRLPLRAALCTAFWATAALTALPAPSLAQGCTSACVPLIDLGPATYQGFQGGLYPGGSLTPPPAHEAAALRAADAVVPRDSAGTPHPDGRIGVLAVGMSNMGQEWREFTRRSDADAQRNGYMTLVDGGVSGALSPTVRDPASPYWTTVDQRAAAAGISPEQVQVIFLEETRHDSPFPGFPLHAEWLLADLRDIVRLCQDRYPNLKVAFVHSVLYAGYANVSFPTEPRAFEQGFSYKWLIEEQLAGDPRLNFDPLRGPVEAPVLLWGPYIWTFGGQPRLDGVAFPPSDFEADGLHPSASGEAKVADLIEDFIAASPTAARLFAPRPGVARVVASLTADASVDPAFPLAMLGGASTLDVEDAGPVSYLRFDLPPLALPPLAAKLAIEPVGRVGGIVARGVSNTTWSENMISASTAPALDGPASVALGPAGRGTLGEWDVTASIPPAGGPFSLALVAEPGALPAVFFARESGSPAWLGITVDLEPGGIVAHCPGRTNQTGGRAVLDWSGSNSLAANDLRFELSGVAPGTVVLPVVGHAATELLLAGGEICVGGPLQRLPLRTADAAGMLTFAVDWSSPPSPVLAGDTRTVQVVFRDPGVGGFRASSALTVVFRP